MIRLVHVINNLQTGGAETTLLRLMERVDRDRFQPAVIAMIGEGTIGPQLRELDIPVVALGAARRRPSLRTFLGVRRHLKALRPDVIQAWMYHSNLAAFLARRGLPGQPSLAWNIRHSLNDWKNEPWLTRKVIKAGARRSPRVEAVIANSHLSMSQHEAIGYRSARNEVIPNGFDLELIRPVAGAKATLLKELGLEDGSMLIGCAGRFHQVKDQAMLASAVRKIAETGLDAHLVLVGRGCETGGPAEKLRDGLGSRLHLLGERRPLAPILSGLDCLAISSRGEGFPNVLAEAMACETPCVTTDVGDAADILGDPDRVVPVGDVQAMAEAINSVLAQPESSREAMGREGRERIASRYAIDQVITSYESLWSDLATGKADRP